MPSSRASLALVLALGPLAGLALGGCNPFKFCSSSFADSAPTATEGAGKGSSSGGSMAGNSAPQAVDATRLVAEADIVQLDPSRNWLYTISRSGTLAVVDASTPNTLTLLGKQGLRGVPFEMYRREGALLVMSNQAVLYDGTLEQPLPEESEPRAPIATASSLLQAIDLSDPAAPKELGTFRLPGEIADSRVVGNVLYVTTYENATCWSCASKPRTVVTSFDISQPATPKQIDQAVYESAPSYPNVTTTTTPWKRSIVANDKRLYVGGLATEATSSSEGVIEVLDISDPGGKMTRGATISVTGPILSRWQMDEYEGTLRVVSQRGAARSLNGELFPDVDTFRVESTSSIVRVGHTTLQLPRQEGLKTVRFDGTRAYAITFETVINHDPLFTIDLSDPTKPTQRGSLDMPGWVFHIVPKGDRLLGLGLDRNSSQGNLNVSLFDVSNLATPKMIQRTDFGPTVWNDATVTNEVIAEDQDRIQKALRVFDDGLVVVPYSDPGYVGGNACTSGRSGVQLLRWSQAGLARGPLLPVPGNPRRALRRDSSQTKEVLAISDSEIRAFDISRAETVVPTASVTIGFCTTRPANQNGGWGGGGGWTEGSDIIEDRRFGGGGSACE